MNPLFLAVYALKENNRRMRNRCWTYSYTPIWRHHYQIKKYWEVF